MKYKYKRYGQETLRPVIEIKVKSSDRALKYHALVDSGADISIFHAEVADYLGINLSKGKKDIVTGVGGKSSEFFLHKVVVEVGGWEHEIEVGFLPVIGGRSVTYGILGQKGFFENFVVKFDYKKGEIELKPRK